MRFGKTNVVKEEFYAAKKKKKNWDANVDYMIIAKSVEIKML